uniref:Uncharacterized protein n=1 Tax=Plectus sambesii TaxID=2011161 RepID=A0A914VSI6_9BILA
MQSAARGKQVHRSSSRRVRWSGELIGLFAQTISLHDPARDRPRTPDVASRRRRQIMRRRLSASEAAAPLSGTHPQDTPIQSHDDLSSPFSALPTSGL